MLMAVAITTNSEAVFVWICYLSARWLGEGLFCSLHCVSLLLLSSAVTQKSGGWIINSPAMFNATMLLSHPLSSDAPQGWFVFNNIDDQFFVENITYSQLLSYETLLFFFLLQPSSFHSSLPAVFCCLVTHVTLVFSGFKHTQVGAHHQVYGSSHRSSGMHVIAVSAQFTFNENNAKVARGVFLLNKTDQSSW